MVGAAEGSYLVSAQSDDAFERPLSTYTYERARFIHIDGVRLEVPDFTDCFDALYNGTEIILNDYSEMQMTPPQNE